MTELNSSLLKSKPNKGLLFVAGLLLVVITLALYSLVRIKEQSRKDVREKLQEVLNTTHEATQNWINDRIDSVQLITGRPDILRLAKDLLSTTDKSQEALSENISLQKMRSIMKPWLDKHSYLGIFVISPDGINVASMRDGNLGEKIFFSKHGNYLDRMLKGSPQIVLPLRSEVALPNLDGKLVRGEPTMFVGVPIYDDEGSVIAAFTIRINPALDFTRTIQMARTGETGDSYAFDQNGALISGVRFNEHLRKIGLVRPNERAILTMIVRDPGGNTVKGYIPTTPREELPLTLMARQATAGNSGYNVDGYRDYRGVPVVGAWLWNDKFKFGLAFEIDVDEAYLSYYSIRKNFINVLLFAIVLF
ncbi:MAG: cache domain-containing protein, partial [Nitrospirales bacterium]